MDNLIILHYKLSNHHLDSISAALVKLHFDSRLICVHNISELNEHVASDAVHIVFMHAAGDDNSYLELVQQREKSASNFSIILFVDKINEEESFSFFREGADDVIPPDQVHRLPGAIIREHSRQVRLSKSSIVDSRISDSIEAEVKIKTKELQKLNAELKLEIQDRAEAMQRLERTEISLNSILENVPGIIYVKDPKTLQYTYINNAARQVFGLEKKDFIGKTIEEVFANDDTSEFHQADLSVISSKESMHNGQVDFRYKGKMIHFGMQKILIKDEAGNPESIIGIMEDFTKLKDAENHLKSANNKLLKIFQSSPIPICIFNEEGLIVDVNNIFEESTGYAPAEVIGKQAESLPFWQSKFEREKLKEETLTHSRVSKQQINIHTKSGEEKTYVISMESIELQSSRLFLSIWNDVTESIKANMELQKALDQQRHLNMLRSQFISMVSHEFRTPLTGIMLSSDLLRRYSSRWSEDERNKHFDRIQDTVLRMANLLENVLVIGRLETGRLDFTPDKLEIDKFFTSIANAIEFNTGGTHQVIFQKHCDNCTSYVDENLLGLILNNLLTNAIKYSPSSEKVYLELLSANNTVEFIVKDSGIGIPKENLSSLFDSFARADNTKGISGYGLGLYIVKMCVDAHGGEINVESKLGKGTAFHVKVASQTI